MRYQLWYPAPGSVNGRSFVDSEVPADLEAARYELAFEGPIPAELAEAEPAHFLEAVFVRWNAPAMTRPATVRSLSVGDVVVRLDGVSETTDAYFNDDVVRGWLCTPTGWRAVQLSRRHGSVWDAGRIRRAFASLLEGDAGVPLVEALRDLETLTASVGGRA